MAKTPKPHAEPWNPIVNNAVYPPYSPQLYPDRQYPVYGGYAGTWGAAADGDIAGLLGNPVEIPKGHYDNVTGNPLWPSPSNPPYIWDALASAWKR